MKDEEKRKEQDGRRDLDAEWGIKTCKGTRADGTAWEKAVKWFGYKLHLVVDSVHELPIAFELTKANESDTTHLTPLIEQMDTKHPEMKAHERRECAADKGYDSAENNTDLSTFCPSGASHKNT